MSIWLVTCHNNKDTELNLQKNVVLTIKNVVLTIKNGNLTMNTVVSSMPWLVENDGVLVEIGGVCTCIYHKTQEVHKYVPSKVCSSFFPRQKITKESYEQHLANESLLRQAWSVMRFQTLWTFHRLAV